MALSKIKFSLICLVDQIRKDASGRNQIPAGIFFSCLKQHLCLSLRVLYEKVDFFHKKKKQIARNVVNFVRKFCETVSVRTQVKNWPKTKKEKRKNLTVQPSTCHKHTQVLDVSNE